MKNILMTVVIITVMVLLLAACNNDATQPSGDITPPAADNSITETTPPTEDDEANIIESDILPEIWHGEWTCVYSEANYFHEGETIFIKDFDNAVLYTEITGDNIWENNRWFFYDEEEQIINIYNEPPPFTVDGWIRETFEIKRIENDEIVLTREGVGQEVRFERSDKSSSVDTSVDAASVDGISPDFKKAMDSYESFFIEYVEFMKEYKTSKDSISMLADFTEYMTQYADMMEKMNAVSETELSDADLKYYLEVTTRITQKLAEVV
jgi:hypothetical protein